MTEILNELLTNLDSFKLQDNLTPKIWTPSDKMKPEVREILLKISQDMFESLALKVDITDVIVTGSISNYNWSEFSDIDLHIVVDFSKITGYLDSINQIFTDTNTFIKDYFDSKKNLFNNKHKIKIYGFDVELYIQDIKEEHVSNGIYSLLKNNWIVTPKHIDFTIDEDVLLKKISAISKAIDETEDVKLLKKLFEKIKRYRNDGLNSNGEEMSVGNILFKALRRGGEIEKLVNKINGQTSNQMSLTEDDDMIQEKEAGKKIYVAKLKDGSTYFKQSFKKEYNSVYVQIYENGEHIIKKWSVTNGDVKFLKSSAKKWNEKKVPQLKQKFNDYKFARITGVYIVRPELLGSTTKQDGITSIDLKFAEIK